MSNQYYLSGFDFGISSNMLVNGDMEINSHWIGSGDQASFFQASDYAYGGQYGWGFSVESSAFYDAKISFEDVTSGNNRHHFTLSENNDLIMYAESADMIHVFNGISDQEKFNFSNPCSYSIRGMTVYSGDLFLSCYDGNYISLPPDNSSWVWRMKGVSSNVDSIFTFSRGGMRSICFDNDGNLIAEYHGYITGDFEYWVLKHVGMVDSPTGIQYDKIGVFGTSTRGAGITAEGDQLYLHDRANDRIIRFHNFSGSISEVYSYGSILPADLINGFEFFQNSYCLLGQSYTASSGDTAWMHLVERWTFDYANYIDRAYLKHNGDDVQLLQGSGYVINFMLYLQQGIHNIRANLLDSAAQGYHFMGEPLNAASGRWIEISLPFSCTQTDSQAIFEYEQSGVIQIYPTFEFKRFKRQIRSDHRMKGGSLFSFKWGDYERFEIPLEYVPVSKQQLVNEWWRDDNIIYFKQYSGSIWEVNTCQIVNKEAPLQKRQKPYTDYFQGKVILETF
jgi:hypothetical protein